MTKASLRYSPEVRGRVVRLVLDHQEKHPSQWAAIQSIAPMTIGCSTERFNNRMLRLSAYENWSKSHPIYLVVCPDGKGQHLRARTKKTRVC